MQLHSNSCPMEPMSMMPQDKVSTHHLPCLVSLMILNTIHSGSGFNKNLLVMHFYPGYLIKKKKYLYSLPLRQKGDSDEVYSSFNFGIFHSLRFLYLATNNAYLRFIHVEVIVFCSKHFPSESHI